MTGDQAIALGRRVLRLETEALAEVERRLGEDFARAVDLLASSRGRVIVSGVGKSGLIGRKIAATLTSTGTPASFLHPVESLHGDLGLVGGDDVAILLSKSGESDEVLVLLEHLKRFGVRTIGIAGNAASSLARECDATLDAWVREEACPHDLAPTTSTTVALALGDALAVVLLERRGFQREDFARVHPGGSLGRKLLTRVRDLMERERLPILPPSATMREVAVLLARRRGIVVAGDADGRLLGVFTAGDFTRLMEREGDPFVVPLERVMTRTPRTAQAQELASAAVYRMEQFGIMAMPVTDDTGIVVGIVHLHDLMRAGVA
ncbi:MAG: D-arabinose 5-phosphate isomerase [Gemmatimonadetes bacterium SCN 70-22]|nr:MAG: D-arabinose 5-phosphate isomerase [Gemmatimonadetes bacterium SCN 70-22]